MQELNMDAFFSIFELSRNHHNESTVRERYSSRTRTAIHDTICLNHLNPTKLDSGQGEDGIRASTCSP